MGSIAILLASGPAWADVAFDAATAIAETISDISQSHTPSGTPRAVIACVYDEHPTTATDPVSGTPTYGGVSMTEVTNSPLLYDPGPDEVAVAVFFLGSNVPTGTQTFAATIGTGVSGVAGSIITLTASSDTEVVNTVASTQNDTDDPSVSLGLLGRTSFVAQCVAGGANDVPGLWSPLTNWTAIEEVDITDAGGLSYRYDIIGSTDVTCGGQTTAATDSAILCYAISEVQATGAASRGPLLGVW